MRIEVAFGLLLLATTLSGSESPLAFPGAEGFGAKTPGGRGGKVIFVRNLNDSGPGSFREAVTAKGPRIVVFHVSGLITLKNSINIREPYLTIAGQTAPGDGICIRGNEVSIRTHDVIVRYMRFRPGDISEGEPDGLDIMEDSHDVIVDHCSATWSIDEDLSPSGNIHDVTVQWSLIAEGLNNSIHHKGPHGYGSLVRAAGGVTLHHNLWAHNTERNPRLGDNYGKPPFPLFDVRNNVMYDYSLMCSGWTGDHLRANYVANYIRPGPSSTTQQNIIALLNTADVDYYVDGNVVEGHPDWTANNALLFTGQRPPAPARFKLENQPFNTPAVRTTSAEQALQDVLEHVGAILPHRDAVDTRIIGEVQERSGGIIDSQWEVGGWPEYHSIRPPVDSDADGIPDEWEVAHGLNPHDPADASAIDPKTGYSHIEEYLNSPPRPTLHVAADGTGEYSSIQKAIDAAPAHGAVISIAPGVYREVLEITKNNMQLRGSSADPSKTVIVFDKSAGTAGGTMKSATVNVRGDDFYAENLTFANDFNTTHPQLPQGSQALALLVTGDRAVFRNVRFLGNQDTLYAANKSCAGPNGQPCVPSRQYFSKCYIEGNVDFIFGDGIAVFEDCEIHSTKHPEGFITAQGKHYPAQESIFVFNRCKLTAEPGQQNVWLGRPWRPYATVVFLNTEMGPQIAPAGWREWHPGETHYLDTVFYAEFNSTGPGARPKQRDPHSKQLTAEEAAKFSTQRVLAGADNWDPTRVP